jgi:hypothetical protein
MCFQIGDLNVYIKMLCVLWWIYELAIKLRISLSDSLLLLIFRGDCASTYFDLSSCSCDANLMAIWLFSLVRLNGSNVHITFLGMFRTSTWWYYDSCNKVKKNVNFLLAHDASCKVGTSNVFAWKIDDIFVHRNSLRGWYDAPLVANVSLVTKPRRVGIIHASR